MALPAWLSTIFKPLTDLVTDMHTSKEEVGQIRLALIEAQIGMAEKVMDYEARLAEAQSKVIIAEAQGQSWLQRNWRPMLMTTFGFIVAWNYVIVDIASWAMAMWVPSVATPPRVPIPEGMWALLQLGVGGYILGRSGEKIATVLAEKGISFGKKDE